MGLLPADGDLLVEWDPALKNLGIFAVRKVELQARATRLSEPVATVGGGQSTGRPGYRRHPCCRTAGSTGLRKLGGHHRCLSISVRSHALASACVATAFIGQGSAASQAIAVIKPRVIADGATLAPVARNPERVVRGPRQPEPDRALADGAQCFSNKEAHDSAPDGARRSALQDGSGARHRSRETHLADCFARSRRNTPRVAESFVRYLPCIRRVAHRFTRDRPREPHATDRFARYRPSAPRLAGRSARNLPSELRLADPSTRHRANEPRLADHDARYPPNETYHRPSDHAPPAKRALYGDSVPSEFCFSTSASFPEMRKRGQAPADRAL
jgi:hypothetical protein